MPIDPVSAILIMSSIAPRGSWKLATAEPALPAAGQKLWLDLGEVHEEAVVKLNGRDLGVVWTKPARVDISAAARAGENDLEVTVVNLWPNRLIGDAGLPPEKRFTETNIRKFVATTPLLPSGLIGPVWLEATSP